MSEKEWLNENQLSCDIWRNKYRWNNETLDQWFERVSSGNPVIKRLIKDKKFLFGGRTLSNINTDKTGSYSNCYSIGYVGDSLDDIMDVATKIAKTFKSQGGQGLSLSKIRPKGALIKGQFKSDGIVPFMEIFNTVTESISQGGSRKGALMMSLDIWHPEAETFITIKSDLNRINKANLSLEIDDEFMEAVEKGITSVDRVFRYNGNEYKYTVNPVKLFEVLCEQAWNYAEPGIIYTNRFRNYNIVEYDPEYVIETSNPCGEQPLSKNSACNLSSINLSEYVINPFTKDAYFDYASLIEDIPYIVKAMDDVLEKNLNNHALLEQKEQAKNWRNIGIGIMGLADVLIKLRMEYGSPEAVGFSRNLMKQLFRNTVFASVALAKERGNYPKYKPCVWDSTIMKKAFSKEELDSLKEINLLRNCSLLSIAPTGSISTLLNVSGGCEPYFALSYTRRTESLNGKESYYKVDSQIVEDYRKVTGEDDLPRYFVTAKDIDYAQRINMQAALQEFCDTAISSTINLTENTTIVDVKHLYLWGWKQGLKGLTIFRDNCKRLGILTTDSKKEESNNSELPRGYVVKAGDNCIGLKRTLTTGCGTLHVTAYFDPETGELRETYLSKGSTGGCQNFMVGLSRMISLAARGGLSIDDILDQLKSCGTCPSYAVRRATKNDTSIGSCCPVAVGNALREMNLEIKSYAHLKEESEVIQQPKNEEYEECPECHAKSLVHESGCTQCLSCGYSKCN